ncbi:MAG: zinc ribbon domain-containing protein [Clostridia bacterium]
MKSIKPGRGPSAMGVWGAVISVIFGIFWTIMASSMGAPAIFPLFGVLFIITGIISGIYNYKNATGKNRYSTFDITDDTEESDPLEQRFGNQQNDNTCTPVSPTTDTVYCPYCGTKAEHGYLYCRKCGNKLP